MQSRAWHVHCAVNEHGLLMIGMWGLFLMLAASVIGAVDANCGGTTGLALRASLWPEADRLFRKDPHWLGADDAHSVDLGNGRVLWLFGDSLIDPQGQGSRQHAVMIRNSIAVQNGYDLNTATLSFFWDATAHRLPSAFFKGSGETWYWPGDGIRLGSRLLIFLSAVTGDANALGFALSGWRAVMVDNPDAPPDRWRITEAQLGRPRSEIIPGTGGVLARDNFVYAYGCDASGSRVYLARWSVDDAGQGNLQDTQWWCGQKIGWQADGQLQASPVALFADGQREFGVYRDAHLGRYVLVQTIGFGAADLGFRTAPQPEGPWSEAASFYHPPEKQIPGVLIYAAKPHAFLTGDGCIVTYATNHMKPQYLIEDSALYFPRVLRTAWVIANQPN